jgi:moderate conductance mechanosensitive channel
MQPHHSSGDSLASTATSVIDHTWGLLPEALQHVFVACARVAITIAIARVLLRLVPALERVIVRRATRLSPSRAVATDSMVDEEQRVATLVKIVISVARAVIGSVTAVMVLSAVGIDVAPLIAGAGIAGVAVGFGAQSIVKDFFSGFFIVLENHYDVGDTVTLNAVTGTVEEMTMRVTVIRDAAGALHYMPNGTIATTTNRTAGWTQASIDLWSPVSITASEVRRVLDEVAAAANTDAPTRSKLVSSVEVEGPLELTGEKVLWRLKGRAKPTEVHAVRERLIGALQRRVPVDEKGVFSWEKALAQTAPEA